MHIRLGNVTLIAQQLLDADISGLTIDSDKKFEMDIQQLRTLLHRYRYASAQHRPPGINTVEWIEQTANDLLQHTQQCLDQLSDKARTQLSEQVNVLHRIENPYPML